jgi:hypothetical protein
MGWREALRDRRIIQQQRLDELEGKYNRPTNYERIMSDAEALKENPNALSREKQLELLAHMKSAGMDKEFDELVNTLRPSRKELLAAAAKGFADNWLAAGLIRDNSYATNPHTSGAKAFGQGLGSATLFTAGHPLAWIFGRVGVGTKLAKKVFGTKKAAVPASTAIAKAAANIGRGVNAASAVSSVGKGVPRVLDAATNKHTPIWNEVLLRDKMSEISDPFNNLTYPINQ